MQAAALRSAPVADDRGRLSALHESGLLDTAPEQALDRLTQLAARFLQVPIAMVNLVDDRREFCKSAFCTSGQYAAGASSPLERSFCLHAVRAKRPLVIPDAKRHPLVCVHPAVLRNEIGAYLGIPLLTPDNHALGTLCVVDTLPRPWCQRDVDVLTELACAAVTEIELRRELLRRRQYEATLELERAHLEQLFTSSPEAVVLLDTRDRVLRVNPEFARMFGYTQEDAEGRTINSLIVPAEMQEAARQLTDQAAAGKRIEAETTRRHKDGRTLSVSVLGAPIHVGEGQVGVYGIYRDISVRKEMERLKEHITAIVSHELRTPLTVLRGSVELLSSGVLEANPERRREMLHMARRSTDRLLRLVNDLLDFERLNSGQLCVQCCWWSAEEVMAEALEAVRPAADTSGVRLVSTPVRAQAYGDPDRLLQVLANLLSNAVKFSHPGGTVWLQCVTQGSEICFSVRDQGRGIPPEKLPVIFEPFEQVELGDSRQKGGTGLGLAICRRIVDLHGGRIWAESETGQGSRFYLTLPVRE
jgi:PAS domain S-box-containing protein